MNNITYLNKFSDPVLTELDNAIDKNSIKKMLAFKYFNNDMNLLNSYLKNSEYSINTSDNLIRPKAQLEFTF
tara:strand:+ start:236 stop:451 length:216 start_codon:yes stop_codon:yes gene_type:complete